MEKNTPHYELAVIKAQVRRLGGNAFTNSAKNTAWALGLNVWHMQEIISELQRQHFYKSMTTYDDHRVWHDVYHLNSQGLEIYIKVTYRPSGGPPVISFKEKNS
ncbi:MULTISPECIES: type II toxin-antitoxin system MqsR family toxin [Pseudomonas]|uniref:Type II toxin-antitoxin system MqsR family toxin n=1 Tax=Pseudomonas fluorescens TaxID=294 RepID=A0A944DNH2_PSEFL|nr:type II toxin-antitoxin system MqsR family toxin [Pseudomonas fluorescens]MBT2311595.1 type II toxin-antitoxin system MqsR family toxin [Pseudomonas fluorescens]MBT2316546.1 type II toxin-antitoxin system MqsR family toxin [Pseudomonas fluorescens]MBT2331957.1 type II toxin-antitoxin system MqsR family toxin [Pseudomonas fluorescens]MBT2344365.1 type II toxin-antitoxin system MqsR family toxin [Pseudomonas fluorescens]MBT2348245.1 type II toxin-antitoxin system MqsR family toxin [Pseudomona